MPGPQVDQLERQILQALPRARDLDAAVKDVLQGLDNLVPGLSTSLAAEISEARERVTRQFERIEIGFAQEMAGGLAGVGGGDVQCITRITREGLVFTAFYQTI